MIDAKGLLLIIAAVAMTAYVMSHSKPSPFTTGYGGHHASEERIGARNHSGIEPIDVFGFRQRGW